MMRFPISRLSSVLIGVLVISTAVEAESQIVRFRRGAGISVNAPGVNVQVGPVGIPGRRRFFARRAFVGQPPLPAQRSGAAVPQQSIASGPTVARQYASEFTPGAGGPTLAAPENSNPVTSNAIVSDERPFPTTDDLESLDDAMLLNALLDVSARLNSRLGRLSTGSGWQRYLRLPDDALPPPAENGAIRLGFKSLQQTLVRFDQVAENPGFTKIATLPSFDATHSALRQVVERFGKLQAETSPTAAPDQATPAAQAVPAKQENLPTPEPAAQHTAPASERSILKR